MATNDYHFITRWRIPARVEEIYEVLGDALALPRWWPSVYMDAQELEPGDAQGIGRVIDLYTKGWLPYTLRWSFRVSEAEYPRTFRLEAWGDFNGRGIWTFTQNGPDADIVYDWKIRADKPLLRNFSFIMKPIFEANHRWAMAQGEESLRLELARRHAASAADRALIPEPPPPTTTSPVPLAMGSLAVLLAAYWLVRRVGTPVFLIAGVVTGYALLRRRHRAGDAL